ncbi:MAG: peptidylprolyl isomerase [Pseudomonadota bacterium]
MQRLVLIPLIIATLWLSACGSRAPEYAAAHILVSHADASQATQLRTRQEARARAEELAQQIAADGSNFAELARQYSDGPSGPRGGYLGGFRSGQVVPQFQAAVESLEIGDFTRSPIETPFGYHLIMRMPLPQPLGANHILIAYEGASRSKATRSKGDAARLASEILVQALDEGANFGSLARQYSDGPSGPRGGALGEFEEGKMVAAFEAAVKATQVGEVHGKVVETEFGFHIIERTK